MNRAVAVTRRQRQARPCRRGSAHRGGMDRGELRPRTLTRQPSPLHTHRPHRLQRHPDQDAVTQRLCARAAGRRRVSHLNAGPHASWLGLAIHEQDGAP